MVRRPSSASNVRVFCGVSISAHTRVMIVADWMAGQFTGSRRSRRSYFRDIISKDPIEICVSYEREHKHSCSFPLRTNSDSEDAASLSPESNPKSG